MLRRLPLDPYFRSHHLYVFEGCQIRGSPLSLHSWPGFGRSLLSVKHTQNLEFETLLFHSDGRPYYFHT